MPSSSAQAAPKPHTGEDLRTRLLWLTGFRLIATSLLLVVALLRLASEQVSEIPADLSWGFGVIAGTYALTVAYALVLRRTRVKKRFAYVQVLVDVLLASGLVLLTGGGESPFTFAYSLAVIAAAALLSTPGALTAAMASALGFGAVLLYPWAHGPYSVRWLALPWRQIGLQLVPNALAQLLIAILASYLARQLSAAGGKLTAREADLKALRQLQERILAQMPSGLLTCNDGRQVTYVNGAGRAILGLADAPVSGTALDSLLPGVGPLHLMRRSELEVETRTGRRILGLSVTPMGEGHDGWLLVFQDLTELRRVELELRRADQLTAMGRLAAQLAHEIRNPLASMRGAAQILAEDAAAGSEASRLLAILVRESDRLSQLVEDVLTFCRPAAPILRACELHRLAEETVEMVRTDPLSRGAELRVEAERVEALADPDQLRQVVLNLVRNALAACEGRGQVVVKVSQAKVGPQLSVWDSAGAIAQADLDRVFEPFFSRRSGGTGLGLSTCHSIVAAHGGSIAVSSSPKEGTQVTVTLPPRIEEHLANPDRG